MAATANRLANTNVFVNLYVSQILCQTLMWQYDSDSQNTPTNYKNI